MNTLTSQPPSHLTPQELRKPQRNTSVTSPLRFSKLPSAAFASPQSCGAQLLGFIFYLSSFILSPAAPPPELTILRQQYDKVVAERVTAPFDASKAALDEKFSAALTNAIATAKQAGKLDDVLAIQDDQKRLTEKFPIPDDSDTTPERLKSLRSIYRQQLGKLEEQRAASHSTLLPAYTAKLQALEVTLTKGDRIAEAKDVKDYREQLTVGVVPAPQTVTPTIGATAQTPPARVTARVVAPEQERHVAQTALGLAAAETELTVVAEGRTLIISKAEDLPQGLIQITEFQVKKPGKIAKGEAALGVLAGLQHLTRLHLENYPLEDDDMDEISTFPALEAIFTRYPSGHFNGSKLNLLVNPESLKRLEFQGSPIGSKGAAAIGRCLNLEKLNLGHALVDDRDLMYLAPLTKLEDLDLRWTKTSIAGIRHLKAMTGLTVFGWSATPKKGLAEFAEIAAMFPQVTTVRLSVENGAKAEDYAGLRAFPALNKVQLEGLVDAKVVFAGLATVPQLAEIGGYSWVNVVDADLFPLQSSKSITTIRVDDAPNISRVGLMSLAQVQGLKALGLSRFKKITEADVQEFKRLRPDVEVKFNK